MKSKIVIVDDQEERATSIASQIAADIDRITHGDVSADTLQNIAIADSLELVVDAIRTIEHSGHKCEGILVDLVDDHITDAGMRLTKILKGDRRSSHYRVVIYTGKYTNPNIAALRAAGADDVIIRESAHYNAQELAEQVIKSFGLADRIR